MPTTSATSPGDAPTLLLPERPRNLPRGQALQARVLQQTLLRPASGVRNAPAAPAPALPGTGTPSSPAGGTPPAHQALIEIRGQTLLIRSETPLPANGERLQVMLDEGGRLRWLDAPAPRPTTTGASSGATAQAASAPLGQASPGIPGQQASPAVPAAAGAPSSPAPPSATATAPPAAAAPDSDWQQAVRRDLPRQAAPLDLARQLATALQGGARLPAAVLLQARAWLDSQPSGSQLQQAGELKQALHDSGQQLEARLRQGVESGTAPVRLEQDGKAHLLRLLAAVSAALGGGKPATAAPQSGPEAAHEAPWPVQPPLPAASTSAQRPLPRGEEDSTSQLLRQLLGLAQGSLSRLQVQQLESLGARQGGAPEPGQPHQTWNYELPVRHGAHYEPLGLRLEEYRRPDAGGWRRSWRVELNLELGAMGRFSALLSLQGDSLAATLWAEQASTHQWVRAHLARLRRGLEEAGAQVRQLDCHHGLAPARAQPPSGGLLDVRT